MIARIVISNHEDFFEKLVAESGLEKMRKFLKEDIITSSKLEDKYNEAIKQLMSFIKGEIDLQTLIPTACFLAKLEHVYRSGKPPIDVKKSFFSNPEEDITRDLETMCKVFKEKFLIPEIVSVESEVVYNPNFRLASNMVGGADGDVMIDGVLYDFKSGKPLGYSWKDVAQLIGYYFLNEISLIIEDYVWTDTDYNLNIKKVAFYKARYGEVEYFDLSHFDRKMVEQTTRKMILHLKENLANKFVLNPHLFMFLEEYN